jgi:hypothetical protein
MIHTRFGGEAKVLRLATKADVLKLDPPLNDEALINLAAKSWAVVELDQGTRIVRLSELRADDGWKEISAAIGTAWECPDCGSEWPQDERCHKTKCNKTQATRRTRWMFQQAG